MTQYSKVENFSRAVKRLEAMVKRQDEEDDAVVDATIKRFEFAFELSWKALKEVLKKEGIDARSPRAVLQEAFQWGWLGEHEGMWLMMLEDRNISSHQYNETKALEIVIRIQRDYAVALTALSVSLTKQDEC